ncbi:MAG: hypothetical protein ACK5LJ_08720 [Paracoccus sp. (in: a-proteobacteria)]
MVDSTAEIKDLNRTEANKTVIRAFVDEVLIGGETGKMEITSRPVSPTTIPRPAQRRVWPDIWRRWQGKGRKSATGSSTV